MLSHKDSLYFQYVLVSTEGLCLPRSSFTAAKSDIRPLGCLPFEEPIVFFMLTIIKPEFLSFLIYSFNFNLGFRMLYLLLLNFNPFHDSVVVFLNKSKTECTRDSKNHVLSANLINMFIMHSF